MAYAGNAKRAALWLVLVGLFILVAGPLTFTQKASAAPSATGSSSSATDNFARANASSLGSNWTATADGGLSISSDEAVGAAGDAGDMWTANSFTSDQYSQVMLTATQLTGSQWVGPSVRAQDSGLNAYVAIYFWNFGSPEIMLFLRNNGGWTELGSPYGVSPLSAGAVLSLQAAGSTLTVAVNGTTAITATDTTFTGGDPGLMTNGTAAAAAWAGGSGAAPAGNSAFSSTSTASPSPSSSATTTSPSPSSSATSSSPSASSSASTSGPSSASDNFDRANASSLGSNWTATADGGLTISSDEAVGAAGDAGDMWTANSFTSDQYSQVMLTATQLTATQWVGPSVRAQDSGLNAYVAIYFWNNGSPEIMLFLRDNGSWSELGSDSTSALSAGAVLSLQAAGSSLTVSVNGVTVITATNSTFTGGDPGLMTNGAATAAAWAGGSGAAPAGFAGQGPVTTSPSPSPSSTPTATSSASPTPSPSPSGSGSTPASPVATSESSSATDNFARASGPMGSNWTATADGGLTISADQAVGASAGNAGDMWTANSFTSDQYSQVMLTATQLTGSEWIGPSVRAQNSGLNAYVAIYYWNSGSPEIMLFLRNNGNWSELGSPYSVSPLSAGAVLSLQAAGSSLTVAVSGSTVITATDTTFTGGDPGLMTNGAAAAAAWAGGSGTAPAGFAGESPATFTVGGTVSGLAGTVVLQDNGIDTLSVSANGSFTFATPLAAGAPYSLTVSSSPSGQACTATNASGTVGSANVTSIAVTCQTIGALSVQYVSTDANGVATYNMTSPIVSGGATEPLRVLAPTDPAPGVAHNFLIALPVEPGEGTTYGDAMSTLESLNAQNQYNLTIIEPSFAIDPWYANSATDPTEQMETFMTDQLVPWIKANLATTGNEQIWLLGFSKSGVGAQDLILKNPAVYTLAASWDFPDSTSYDALGTSEETGYGTNANFVANYELSQNFVNTYAAPFTAQKRIWIGGYYYFEWDVYDTYAPELTSAGVQYDEEPATEMDHNWGSGWVPSALAALYQDSINLSS